MQAKDGLRPHGIFKLKHFRDGKLIHEEETNNIVVTEGKDYMEAVALEGFTPKTAWYLAMFTGNTAPVVADTAGTQNAVHPDAVGTPIATRLVEAVNPTHIVETVRQAWTPNAANEASSSSNSDAPAVYTMNADDIIYGAYMISSATQAGVAETDVVLAAASFSTPRSVFDTDLIQLVYEIILT